MLQRAIMAAALYLVDIAEEEDRSWLQLCTWRDLADGGGMPAVALITVG
jgi:hypothetical protein